MKITVLCTNSNHPVFFHLQKWCQEVRQFGHFASLINAQSELESGDVLFLVSCSDIIGPNVRKKFNHVLVLHASDLPKGRGWSPYIWSILNGAREVTVSLIGASEPLDSGPIYLKKSFTLEGHELLDEIHSKLFSIEMQLMSEFVSANAEIAPYDQKGNPGEYFRKRTPLDNKIDPSKSIEEQFDLLRVSDNERFPAFFELRGKKYILKLEKID